MCSGILSKMLFRVNCRYDQSSRRLFGFDNCIIDAAYRLFWSEMAFRCDMAAHSSGFDYYFVIKP